LLAFSLLMLVLLLLVDGFTTKTVGASSTGATSLSTSALEGKNPILVATPDGKGLTSTQPDPGKRIALTFDDGPNPTYTPQIARILLANHVPATFFEVGSAVVRNQAVVRMLYHDGFEIGNHTRLPVRPRVGSYGAATVGRRGSGQLGAEAARPCLRRDADGRRVRDDVVDALRARRHSTRGAADAVRPDPRAHPRRPDAPAAEGP
jgi:hypothetical protein